MAREKHDKKAGGLIESMDINYSVIWAIKQKPSMTFCPLYVLLRGMKKKIIATSLPITIGEFIFEATLFFLEANAFTRFFSTFKQMRTSGAKLLTK